MIPGLPAFKSPEKATELQPLVAEMISHLSIAMNNLRAGATAEYPQAVAEVDTPPSAQTSSQPEYAAPSPQEQVATKISTLDDVRRAREQAARAYAEAAASPAAQPQQVAPAQPAEATVVDLDAARRARELAAQAYAETTPEAAAQMPYKDPNDAAA